MLLWSDPEGAESDPEGEDPEGEVLLWSDPEGTRVGVAVLLPTVRAACFREEVLQPLE